MLTWWNHCIYWQWPHFKMDKYICGQVSYLPSAIILTQFNAMYCKLNSWGRGQRELLLLKHPSWWLQCRMCAEEVLAQSLSDAMSPLFSVLLLPKMQSPFAFIFFLWPSHVMTIGQGARGGIGKSGTCQQRQLYSKQLAKGWQGQRSLIGQWYVCATRKSAGWITFQLLPALFGLSGWTNLIFAFSYFVN